MSERAHPVDLPADLERAVEVLGNRVRVAALLALVSDGRATSTELAGRLDVSRELVRHHMNELERLGVVDVDPPRSEPEVRRRFFRVNRSRLDAVLATLAILRGVDRVGEM